MASVLKAIYLMPDKWKQMGFGWTVFLNRFVMLSDECQGWHKGNSSTVEL